MATDTVCDCFNEFEVGHLKAAVENQGKWFYMLAIGALEAGMSWDDIREIMRKAGHFKGYNDFLRTPNLNAFARAYLKESYVKANEVQNINISENELKYEVYHCPLVKSWKHFTDEAELISKLCDVYMDYERGIMETYGWSLEIGEVISRGDSKCTICIRKTS